MGNDELLWQPVMVKPPLNKPGTGYRDATPAALKRYLVAIKGPITPGGGHRSINVTLRQNLIYTPRVRPVQVIIPAPLFASPLSRTDDPCFAKTPKTLCRNRDGVGTEAAKGLIGTAKRTAAIRQGSQEHPPLQHRRFQRGDYPLSPGRY